MKHEDLSDSFFSPQANLRSAAIPALDDVVEIDARAIAAATQTDVRSVRKMLGGGHVRGLAGARIRRALSERAQEAPCLANGTTRTR